MFVLALSDPTGTILFSGTNRRATVAALFVRNCDDANVLTAADCRIDPETRRTRGDKKMPPVGTGGIIV